MYIRLAEYNTPCLQTIKRKFLGPPQTVLLTFNAWWQQNEQALQEVSNQTGYFKLSSWEGKVNHIFEGTRRRELTRSAFRVYSPDALPEIDALDLAGTEIEEEEVIGLGLLPNLKKLNINQCLLGGSIKLVGRYAPNLTHLYMAQNMLNDLMFLGLVRKLGGLEELDIGHCVMLSDWSLQNIMAKCKNLKKLTVGDSTNL